MMTPVLYHTGIIRYSKYNEKENVHARKLKAAKKDGRKEGRRGPYVLQIKVKYKKKEQRNRGRRGSRGRGYSKYHNIIVK